MSCSEVVGTYKLQGAVSAPAPVFFPAGALLAYLGMHGVDFGLVAEVLAGDVELAPGYQLIRVRERNPELPRPVDDVRWQSRPGRSHVRQRFGETAYFWLQPGLLARVRPGGEAGFFQASLTLTRRACGQIVGQRSVELYPASHTRIVTVSGFVPTIGVDRFRGIVVGNDCHDIEVGWFCRTAIDPEAPGDWAPIGRWLRMADGNNEHNTGDGGSDLRLPAAIGLESHSLVQLGFGGRVRRGGTEPRGRFRVVGGFTYA